MAFSLIAHTAKGTAQTGGTTTGIDTTGADLIVIGISRYDGPSLTITDSKSNTWTALTDRSTTGHAGVRMYYCISPTVGASHTFTISSAACYAVISVTAWSGNNGYDTENGATWASGTTKQPGSITPAQNNELLVAIAVEGATGTFSVDSGFTISDQVNYSAGVNMGGVMVYLVQGSLSAVNPTFTKTGASTEMAAAMASFKAAAGGGTPVGADAMYHYLRNVARAG